MVFTLSRGVTFQTQYYYIKIQYDFHIIFFLNTLVHCNQEFTKKSLIANYFICIFLNPISYTC